MEVEQRQFRQCDSQNKQDFSAPVVASRVLEVQWARKSVVRTAEDDVHNNEYGDIPKLSKSGCIPQKPWEWADVIPAHDRWIYQIRLKFFNHRPGAWSLGLKGADDWCAKSDD